MTQDEPPFPTRTHLDTIFEVFGRKKFRNSPAHTSQQIVERLEKLIERSRPIKTSIENVTEERTSTDMVRAHLLGMGIEESAAKWFASEYATDRNRLSKMIALKAKQYAQEQGENKLDEFERRTLNLLKLYAERGSKGVPFAILAADVWESFPDLDYGVLARNVRRALRSIIEREDAEKISGKRGSEIMYRLSAKT